MMLVRNILADVLVFRVGCYLVNYSHSMARVISEAVTYAMQASNGLKEDNISVSQKARHGAQSRGFNRLSCGMENMILMIGMEVSTQM